MSTDLSSNLFSSTKATKPTLGTCYYPEQWPREKWQEDAQQMAQLGLTWVRIAEFSWGVLEPTPGDLQWQWLDDAIDVLGQAGLKVVLGTPSATPPRWMLDKWPDMLACDEHGHAKKFGSRRHYCFSHLGYREESVRMAELMAKRYGSNPYIHAWQVDNEYGCHDTTYSYSDAAEKGFRVWLQQCFTDIKTLNQAWGNVFWSMQYNSFDQIELPNATVTEANPAHHMAYRRFSSDQVCAFNLAQVQVIKAHSKAPVSHNFMGRITDFDHVAVAQDLDFVTWDSYPLGFLEDRVNANTSHQCQYERQGDPDFQAFHHDLYRGVGNGRWWVMEQQPGPVNWAPYNPAPLPGMVRLWSWEALAHGAEAVCYFRWRQAPFAQEQMHSGLLRPDSSQAPCYEQVRQLAQEIEKFPISKGKVNVALVFDYHAQWAWEIQPHAANTSYFDLVFDCYRALRKQGLSVDILPPSMLQSPTCCDQYQLIWAPGLMHMNSPLKQTLSQAKGHVVWGPRSAAKTQQMAIPVPLPPSVAALPVTVLSCESLRPDRPIALDKGGHVINYREILSIDNTGGNVLEHSKDGEPVLVQQGKQLYLSAWLDQSAWQRVVQNVCNMANITTHEMPEGVRRRDTQTHSFWFNYDNNSHQVDAHTIEPGGVLIQ